MARIRTIKPEFPQSESMGRVSRDARLLFVLLWPICDDHGRTRAASRMLASLLFPYDDDAPGLIGGWLDELEAEGCIERYEEGGSTYLHIPKWLIHQKIDKPSKPQFPEPPRALARIREDSSEEGKGKEGKGPDLLSADTFTADDPADSCPHQQIIAAYHRLLPQLAQVREWTPTRQKLLRSRWREKAERQSLAWWEDWFRYVASCDFLVGKGPLRQGGAPFEADLEWLIRPSNFVKVCEGKYENRGGA